MAELYVYDPKQMSISLEGGEDEEADRFLKDKLCEQGLKVLEVYAGWAGRCKSILPLLKRLKLERDYEESCFVMLHCQAERHELLSEFAGKSMPHFLVYRNGILKATIKGANIPEIERLIIDQTPTSADADDPEENPMYVRRKEEQAQAAEAA